MLHASAVVNDERVIIVVGDKGSGKTTLGLKAALLHGMRYLSNDHLIVFGDANAEQAAPLASRLILTALPTPIPLKTQHARLSGYGARAQPAIDAPSSRALPKLSSLTLSTPRSPRSWQPCAN